MSKAKTPQPATGGRQPSAGKRQTAGEKRPPKSAAPARGTLKPMRVSMGFREFVLDQLGGVPDLRAKAMFGGVGLYAGDDFFGIIAADVLYFKADETNRRDYEAAGSQLFEPYANAPPATKPMTMPYYSVPLAVLESTPAVVAWAKKSIAVAKAAKKARAAKSRRPQVQIT